MKYIDCSKCGARKNIRHQRYRELLNQYNGNRDYLEKTYLCRACKKFLLDTGNKQQPELSIENMRGYRDLQNRLSDYALDLHIKGIGDAHNRRSFYEEVKKILEEKYIRDFTINIKDNKVVSITIKNIPFSGTHDIQINI